MPPPREPSSGLEFPALAAALSLDDLEAMARERLEHMPYEYIASGAADELTVGWNRAAFGAIRLRPRVLREVSAIDTRVRLLGRELPHPILLAPTAYHRVVHPEGELATARGAGQAGTLWVISTATNTPLEQIAEAATGPLWFQLYMQSDRGFTRELVQHARSAGCEALCVTVDNVRLGARNRQQRSGFRMPPGVVTPYLDDLNSGRRDLMTAEPVSITWAEIEWLQGEAGVPVVLKGILTAEDARRAVQAGAAGVIVSNHGGRNLDTLPAAIDALPEVAEAVRGELPVLVDGGVRRGTDLIKARALGAEAVLIGRPYLYGLAAGGAEGVRRSVEILRHELELALALVGCASYREVDARALW